MSLLSQICSLETQKYLMSKNLMFQIEKVLRQKQKGEITLEQAKSEIDSIIDGKGSSLKVNDENENLKQKEGNLGDRLPHFSQDDSLSFGGDEKQITFVSDDDSYGNSISSSVSSMFDVYLSKPMQGFGSPQSKFDPFSDLNFSPEFEKPNFWFPPKVDWSKVAKLNDCVVLYRTHSQSRSIEEAFLKAKVPYRLVSGTRFLDRKEIKDVVSILKFVYNSADKISLSRFLPLVLEGVGVKTLDKILAFMEDPDYPLPPKFQELIINLLTNLHRAWTESKTLIDLCKEVQIVSGYSRYLKKEYPNKDDLNERLENIGEIYSLMLPFDEDKEMDLMTKLENFLSQIALMSMVDNTTNDPDQPKINLMSLHQSKGLEYETVFLVGCEDGLLPHTNSFMEQADMEEEVRLAYVGVTRAKQNLFLISAESRISFGQIKANPVSRIFRPFIDKYCVRVK
jgi:hypothetical protein